MAVQGCQSSACIRIHQTPLDMHIREFSLCTLSEGFAATTEALCIYTFLEVLGVLRDPTLLEEARDQHRC